MSKHIVYTRDGKAMGVCKHCGQGVWKYFAGTLWRGFDFNSNCTESKLHRHEAVA